MKHRALGADLDFRVDELAHRRPVARAEGGQETASELIRIRQRPLRFWTKRRGWSPRLASRVKLSATPTTPRTSRIHGQPPNSNGSGGVELRSNPTMTRNSASPIPPT